MFLLRIPFVIQLFHQENLFQFVLNVKLTICREEVNTISVEESNIIKHKSPSKTILYTFKSIYQELYAHVLMLLSMLSLFITNFNRRLQD